MIVTVLTKNSVLSPRNSQRNGSRKRFPLKHHNCNFLFSPSPLRMGHRKKMKFTDRYRSRTDNIKYQNLNRNIKVLNIHGHCSVVIHIWWWWSGGWNSAARDATLCSVYSISAATHTTDMITDSNGKMLFKACITLHWWHYGFGTTYNVSYYWNMDIKCQKIQ